MGPIMPLTLLTILLASVPLNWIAFYAIFFQVIQLTPRREFMTKNQTPLERQLQANEKLLNALDPSGVWSKSKRKEVESQLNEAAATDRPTYLKLMLNLLESFECDGTRASRPTKNPRSLLAQLGHGDAAKYYCKVMYLLYPELTKFKLKKLESKMKAQDWVLQAKLIGMTGTEANTVFEFVGEISPPELQAVSECIKQWYNLKKDHPSLAKLRAAVVKNEARMQAQHESKGIDPSKTTKKPKIKFGDQSMWYLFWFIMNHELEDVIQPLVPDLIPYLRQAGLVVPTNGKSLSFRSLLHAMHQGGQEYDTRKQGAFIRSIYGHAVAPVEQAASYMNLSDDDSSVDVGSEPESVIAQEPTNNAIIAFNEVFDAEVETVNNSIPVNETQTFSPLTSPVLNASNSFVATAEEDLFFLDLNSPSESVRESPSLDSIPSSPNNANEGYIMVHHSTLGDQPSDDFTDNQMDQSFHLPLAHHVPTTKRAREYDEEDDSPAQRPRLYRELSDDYLYLGLEDLNGCDRDQQIAYPFLNVRVLNCQEGRS